jgi:hypothetical protein
VVQNTTHFWAFLEGSTTNYACAGYPGQATTPVVRNVVRSSLIDLTHDIDGHPIVAEPEPDSLLIGFDVYRDVPLSGNKSYGIAARYYESGCLMTSGGTSRSYKGDEKDWYRHEVIFAIPSGATEVEIDLTINSTVALGCVSHAPLFDNVTVERTSGHVTAVQGPASQLVLRQNRPNPFNPVTTIDYEVPGGAERVTLRVYDVSGRLVRTLVDGRQPEGVATATWDGRNDGGGRVASGVYFYRLEAGDTRATRRMVLLK